MEDVLSNEAERLDILHQYGVLEASPDHSLDDVTSLAAQICNTPIALITLIDERRQVFSSKIGTEINETARELSFCEHALKSRDLIVVPDATKDARFARHPMVTGESGIRFYAGAPLVVRGRAVLGTLCVIDRAPRTLTRIQGQALKMLAGQVVSHFERKRSTGTIILGDGGTLAPGVHDCTLDEFRPVVDTNPHRNAMWLRFISLLSLPILNGRFSHAYLSGDFVSRREKPEYVDLVLQPAGPYGPASFSAVSRLFGIGLDRVTSVYSIRLGFWIEGAPDGLADLAGALGRPAKPGYPFPDPARTGLARIDLRAPNIVAQFQRALEPKF